MSHRVPLVRWGKEGRSPFLFGKAGVSRPRPPSALSPKKFKPGFSPKALTEEESSSEPRIETEREEAHVIPGDETKTQPQLQSQGVVGTLNERDLEANASRSRKPSTILSPRLDGLANVKGVVGKRKVPLEDLGSPRGLRSRKNSDLSAKASQTTKYHFHPSKRTKSGSSDDAVPVQVDVKTFESGDPSQAENNEERMKRGTSIGMVRRDETKLRDLTRGLPKGGIPMKAAVERQRARMERQKGGRIKSEAGNVDKSSPAIAKAKPDSAEKAANLKEESQRGAPRVQIINGQIVVNEDSLIVAPEKIVDDDCPEITENSASAVTSFSFSKRAKSERWTMEETKKFYSCLRKCGTDFSLMVQFFPGRTRRQLKNKFKREEKSQKRLVDQALGATIPWDIDIPVED